MASMRSP